MTQMISSKKNLLNPPPRWDSWVTYRYEKFVCLFGVCHLEFKSLPVNSIPPFVKGSCEKIQVGSEIGFPCCPGDGKICAGKIGGTGIIPNCLPVFREGTQAT